MQKKILAALTALLMVTSAYGCSGDTSSEAERVAEVPNYANTEALNEEELSQIPESRINRKSRPTSTPMGDDGTWTIFVYLCGSNLESDGGSASRDMQEMMDSSANENVRFVVQTGGSSKWTLDVNPDAAERYVVTNGSMECVWTGENVSMGSSETLTDFLQWGIAEYPAANMGLVFWDHGSGSINGVCFDENYKNDCLLLKDIDAALYSIYDDMTEKFEFIGFDACLMATAEAAGVLATHANYFVASQETEPSKGWDYKAIGDYLAKNPTADGAELGKAICDSYYKACTSGRRGSDVTLSVTDLSRFDNFITAFDDFSQELYEMTGDGNFPNVARSVSKADNFGGNNRSSGYTNMVDTAGILNSAKADCPAASAALSALKNTIVYQVCGKDHSDACGLSMYYPLMIQGSQELSIYKDVALSAYYLGLVDKIAYGASGGDISTYDNSEIFGLFSNDYSIDNYTEEDGELLYTVSDDDEWDYADDYEAGNAEFTFVSEPTLDDENGYNFTLTEEALEKTDYVEAGVYMVDDEQTIMIDLGISGEVYLDWESGYVGDLFDGYWFALPDGQLLCSYLYEKCDGYDIYSCPILLNGEEEYLRFVYDYEETEVWILDIWDGVDDNGCVGRTGIELEEGDVIVPQYTVYALSDDYDDVTFEGDPYTYDGNDDLTFELLPDGLYYYGFFINDIYGNYASTDLICLTVEGEEFHYSSMFE